MTAYEQNLWIRTVLALAGTEPQRRAFIEGYNGGGPPLRSSRQMLESHQIGSEVSALLNIRKDHP